jgi:hypothetical protein
LRDPEHRVDEWEASASRTTPALQRAAALFLWPLVLAPAVAGFLYVRWFGVSVVFSDAWSMARLFGEWSSGTLGLSDFWAPHNEHRMLFPKGVEFLLGIATGYDNVAEMYLIEACFLVTLTVLLVAFADGGRLRSLDGAGLLLFLPVSLLVFSLRQYENMLFGFQINFAFTQTFGVLALFLLRLFARGGPGNAPGTVPGTASFAGSLACATVASFSTALGLLVWPAGLLGLLVGHAPGRAKTISVAAWVLAGVAAWVAYFADYSPPGDASASPSPLYVFGHPAAGARYFLNLLGSSLFWQEGHAFFGGLLVALLALSALVLVAKDGRLGEDSFWVSLLLYSLLMLAAITAGRAGLFGAWQALAPRYTTFSLLAAASAYAMLARMSLGRRPAGPDGEPEEGSTVARAVPLVALCGTAVLAGAVLYSAAVSYPNGMEAGRATEAARERAALVLLDYESQRNRILSASLGTGARVVEKYAPVLDRLGYNVFSKAPRSDGF